MQVRLKRLKVNRFRTVAPGVELVFNDGFNVLLGRNGTGKTTLLDLISAIVGSRFEAYRNEHFSVEYEMILSHVTLDLSDVTLRVAVEWQGQRRQPAWSYEISVQTGPGAELCKVSGSQTGTVVRQDGRVQNIQAVSPTDSSFPSFALDYAVDPDFAQGGSRGHEYGFHFLYQHLNCIRFDEGLDAYRRMAGPSSVWSVFTDAGGTIDLVEPGYCPGRLVLALRVLGEEDSREQLGDQSTSNRLTDDEVPFLKRAVEVLGFVSANLDMRLMSRDVEPDNSGVRWSFGNPAYTFTTDAHGSIITQSYLSYGQKRLVAFLYYLEANDDIIIVDELVNGMHYEWIEACVEAIGCRQAFLTSQNPLLLDALPIGSADDAQRSFVQCSAEQSQGRSTMVWRNLTQSDASAFFSAYEVGIQHVGEILRTRGLW